MGKVITIDPITRIEGHLRINIEVENKKIKNAWSTGTMFRGIELILKGRDPREAWIFTQRICGVCTTVHAIASVRAVENALDLEIPLNAQLIRNLIICAHNLHDHIVHFYHLSALDWVDIVSAGKADPKATAKLAQSLSSWPGNSEQEFKLALGKVKAILASGQLGIFSNGYWGHPAMKLPPEVNLMAVTHYIQALEYQRRVNNATGLLGSKTPHIQNLAVGGVANAIDLDDENSLNMTKLLKLKSFFEEVKDFIHQVYLVDVIAISSLYSDWGGFGGGVKNYLSVPDLPTTTKGDEFDLPGGTIMDGDLNSFKPISSFNDAYFKDNVSESIARSWYDGNWTKHPYEETTEPKYTGINHDEKYSWIKSPRFQGKPMQVGPLAQILAGYAQGHESIKKYVDFALNQIKTISKQDISTEALHSTPGRHLARAIRAAVIIDTALSHWDLLVENIGNGDLEIFNQPEFPKGEIRGFSIHEAPRGALSHWIVIEDGKIKNYQAVVPSTWNAGPRDEKDQMGPYEASLIDNPIEDSEKPLEALRTIHSFDPCLACAVHVFNPSGKKLSKIRIV
ncbi:hydrogenase 2 large subunit [Candidatus Magnetomoraceae bacterium gMMP-1]